MSKPSLYAGTYRTTKRRWTERITAEGGALCQRCGEWIDAGEPWDLGHDDATDKIRGPEHPFCNRSDGGRKGSLMKARSFLADGKLTTWDPLESTCRHASLSIL